MALKCLSCGVELTQEEIDAPSFLQICSKCKSEVDFGGKGNGKK
jgi:predicted Zn-ribbon and HTH transcriptional regulator